MSHQDFYIFPRIRHFVTRKIYLGMMSVGLFVRPFERTLLDGLMDFDKM